jgi:hypothetical protein
MRKVSWYLWYLELYFWFLTFLEGVHAKKKIGNLKGLIHSDGIGFINIEKVDNKNVALVDDEKKEHSIKVNVPKFWKLDEKITHQLKYFNANQ